MRDWPFKKIIEDKTLFVPVESMDEGIKQVNRLHGLSSHYGAKIRAVVGVWIDGVRLSTHYVVKVDLLQEPTRDVKQSGGVNKKYKLIKSLRNKGYSLQRIAERLNCSRQAISQMIKYYEIKEKEE